MELKLSYLIRHCWAQATMGNAECQTITTVYDEVG